MSFFQVGGLSSLYCVSYTSAHNEKLLATEKEIVYTVEKSRGGRDGGREGRREAGRNVCVLTTRKGGGAFIKGAEQ